MGESITINLQMVKFHFVKTHSLQRFVAPEQRNFVIIFFFILNQKTKLHIKPKKFTITRYTYICCDIPGNKKICI